MEKNKKYFNKAGSLKKGYVMDYSGDTPKVSRLTADEKKQIASGKVREPTEEEAARVLGLAKKAGFI